LSDCGIGSGCRFDLRQADANWGIADHLAALAIEAPRFSNHLRTGAAGLLGKSPMNAVQSVVAKLFLQTERYRSTRQNSVPLDVLTPDGLIICEAAGDAESCGMTDQQDDPLAQFGLDAIDLRWTLKDIDSKRTLVINKDHLPKLIELGLVEMREGTPYLTTAGQIAAWQG
jgi:hypothetical protein